MKKIFNIKYLMLAGLLALGFASCKKDSNGGVNGTSGGKGAPTIGSVHTLSKTVTDTISKVYTTYSSTGTLTYDTALVAQSIASPFDSTTVTGVLGNYYVIKGTNLGSTTKILINGVAILFNRALNSDKTLVFNIPSNIPYVQPQKNTIEVVTLYGDVTYAFTTLPPPPTILSVSDYNFSASAPNVSLTGKGFSAVTGITLKATGEKVTITSMTDSTLVLTMPTTKATRSTLLFAYTAGGKALQTASTAEFVDIDNNYSIFVSGGFKNDWQNASWASPSGASASAPSKSGKGSFVATYPAGGWQIEGMASWTNGIDYDASYKYLSFWVKGGTADHTLVLVGDQMVGGYGQVQNANAYTAQLVKVPANVWTYYKIPLTNNASNTQAIDFWAKGTNAKQLGFFLQGMTGDVNETMYFDEVMFVK